MQPEHKTVFISYRRSAAKYIALLVYKDLRANDYDAFIDVESIDSGAFDTIILRQIEARAHFVLILTPGTVERCAEPGDWLRREIEYAMDTQRNIVPLLLNNFAFKGTEPYLTGKLAELGRYNGLTVPDDYFDAAMDRLRTRFLKQPVYGVIRDAPTSDQPEIQRRVAQAAAQPAPTEQQLSAEDYFNRGVARKAAGDLDGAIDDYEEATRLNPLYFEAFYNRGLARQAKSDLDGAIADYSEAIHLNPQFAYAYRNRGIVHNIRGDFKSAIADYQKYLDFDSRDRGTLSSGLLRNGFVICRNG